MGQDYRLFTNFQFQVFSNKKTMVHIIDLQHQGLENVIASFLVETSKGPVLIETGPYSDFERLKSGVEDLGYTMSDIQHVLLTHIHFDHAGASWALADHGAKIYLHPVGKPHMASPAKLVKSATRIYGDQMDTLWGAINPIHSSLLITCDHGEEVKIGDTTFTAWHTPGHASHHIAWQCEDRLFTGDVAGVKINNKVVVPPCPPPDIHIEAWEASIVLIRQLPVTKLYLTHFGMVENINRHLDDLLDILNHWALWMKPHAESNDDIQDITPRFQKYVSVQLKEKGLTSAEIERYESANPSWMSVTGLIRYWKKKFAH